jgi:hypothetical protein
MRHGLIRCLAVLASIALLSGGVDAKQKRITWQGAACDYTIKFDPAKVPEKALRDTAFLLYEVQAQGIVSALLMNEPKDIAKIDLGDIEKTCRERRTKLEGLDLLTFEGFKPKLEAFRASLIEQLDDECDFSLAHAKGYTDPAALRAYKRAPMCEKYVTAIEDDAKLRPTWFAFIDELCKDNASVADCRARERAKEKLPDAKAWMKLTLIDFAWNNCANNQTLRNTTDNEAARTALTLPFSKIYRVKETCEEP